MFLTGLSGALENPRTFLNVSVPDGAAFDINGNYYTASYSAGAIIVFNPGGEEIGRITFHARGEYDATKGQQGNASNCVFGGPQNKTLYVTGDGGAYSIGLKIPGRIRPPLPVGIRHWQTARRSLGIGQSLWFRAGQIPWQELRGHISLYVYDIRSRQLAIWKGDVSEVPFKLNSSQVIHIQLP